MNITIFEKTAHIGGRTLTVNVYDDPLNPVELGASIFIEANHILRNATKNFNLGTQDPGSDEKGVLGIWDGDKFVYTQDSESSNWWNLAKLFWKYGTAPYYIYRLVQNTVATFLKLYQPPYFPFRSLSATAFELGLVKVTGVTGQQFLAESKLDGAFAHDIVQASTRVNYASNLPFIHGLGTMVSLIETSIRYLLISTRIMQTNVSYQVAMAPEGAMAVTGGNWQIFSNMVTDSKAYVALNSTVSSISKESSSDPDSTSPKYTIKTKTTSTTSTNAEAHPITFDDVVIAAPYQFSGISSDADVIPHPVDEIPYVTLHVTLFASPLRFSPEFFHLDPNATVPSSVLTTLGENDEAKSGPDAVGSAGFFSASLVKTVTNPKTDGKEYVYKIFSPDKVKPEFLSRLLGAEVPDTFTSSTPSDAAADPVSWYHPTVFHPYPQKLPRVTFQDPVLGDGLYYTSGIESFISTMETSALMGMNVARLIVDDYLGISHDGEGEGEGENKENAKVVDSEQENVREHVEGKQKILENSGRPFPDVDEL